MEDIICLFVSLQYQPTLSNPESVDIGGPAINFTIRYDDCHLPPTSIEANSTSCMGEVCHHSIITPFCNPSEGGCYPSGVTIYATNKLGAGGTSTKDIGIIILSTTHQDK